MNEELLRSRGMGHIPNLHDPDAFDMIKAFADPGRPDIIAAAHTPDECMDMEKFILYTYDQGQSSSCVGHAVIDVAGILAAQAGNPLPRLSALAAYTGGRWQGEHQLLDVGSRPDDVSAFVVKHGFVREAEWPLDMGNVNTKLPGDVLQKGESAKLDSYFHVYGSGEQLIENLAITLSSLQPMMISMQVDNAMQDYSGGVIREMNSRSQGGHMVTAHGYAKDLDDKYGFKLRCHTSWGLFGETSVYHPTLSGFFWLSGARVVQSCSDFMPLRGAPKEVV